MREGTIMDHDDLTVGYQFAEAVKDCVFKAAFAGAACLYIASAVLPECIVKEAMSKPFVHMAPHQ